MRIYMTIFKGEQNIRLHQIRFDNRCLDDHKPPEIFIKIHKKYEEYFLRPQVVKLHDKHGKTLFLAMECRLNFRCYESDIDDFNGIEIVARDIGIPGVGPPSKRYMEKLLANVVRVKFVRHVPSKKELREEKRIQKRIEILKAQNAERLKKEHRQRMRYYPVLLKRMSYHWYFLKIVIKNRLVFKESKRKVLEIIPEVLIDTPP